MTEHKRSVHDRMTNECKKCDYKVKYCCSLLDHMKADYEDIVYGCVKCGYAVKSKLFHLKTQEDCTRRVLPNTLILL